MEQSDIIQFLKKNISFLRDFSDSQFAELLDNSKISRYIPRLVKIVFLFIVVSANPVFSNNINDIPSEFISGAIDIREDVAELGEYILHPDKTAALKLFLVSAGTGSLILIDEDIRHEVKKRSGKTLDAMERIFEPLGRWEIQGVLGGGFLGTGYLMKDAKMVEASLTGLEAYAISGGLVEIIKFISGRERPYKEEGNDAFFEGGVSFPSGHATRSFAWAATISEYYNDKKIVPVISYTMATLISLSRLESDRHWASDVFLGGCLGFAIGKGVSHLHLKSKKVSFSPIITEDIVAFSSSFRF